MNPPKRSSLRNIWLWGDVRQRKPGMWGFALNRLTGLGLVLYLYLHLVVLSQLAGGAYDRFVALAKSPLFLLLDVVLLAGLLLHSLNGVRLTLHSFGIGVASQKTWFIVVAALALVGTVAGALAIFGVI